MDAPSDDLGDGTENGTDDSGSEATVRLHSHTEFGDILVGSDGFTVYNFDADSQGESTSECHDECADAWPPVTVEGNPRAEDGVDAELTTFEREDGSTQVAANGWPLYYFEGDETPGDVDGQGVNDVWWVLDTDGIPIRTTGDDDNEEESTNESTTEADEMVLVGADGEPRFAPDSLEITSKTEVAFVWDSGGHNIAVEMQPDSASWVGVSDVRDEGYTHRHTFEVSGTYDYVCEPHEGQGMIGSIEVTKENGGGSGPSY